ncbi:HD domain-containing protein [Chitiniphilus eburneus]|uniref:HD domain-containing protein n=1 Tax=Chitiniphilus eburneus TaxID=2571148 RepID=A0A4V6WI79_9NEIS|nr:HD domain-containing protein [Chitiniphilus eburneus]TJZ72968.1 HD domain-containing protein [Chitiniphilus eburneus]
MSAAFQDVVAFALELEKLKGVLRRNKPLGQERYENSGEHSWQIALLALAMQPHGAETVDIGRVVQMLLVHDVPEIDAGDTMIYDTAGRAAAEAAERAGAERIFGLLPEPQRGRFMALWLEFTEGQTPEARYARAIDRVMPMLQNIHNRGQSWREHQVRVAQVVATNQPKVAPVFPDAWTWLSGALDGAVARGDLVA